MGKRKRRKKDGEVEKGTRVERGGKRRGEERGKELC